MLRLQMSILKVTLMLRKIIYVNKFKGFKAFALLLLFLFFVACTPINSSQNTTEMHTNALAQETSPYLLQHAHNPVNWLPWGDSAFEKAVEEDKLVIISIGYSACHWCHVMEHESFEDSSVAAIMNDHFISIKVDREERPDVDQIYMTAVQLMTGQGGWPLNVITLPDGRPIWGGTYFRKEAWVNALQSIAGIYKDDPAKVLEYAEKLTEGVLQSELVQVREQPGIYTHEDVGTLYANWSKDFDVEEGGMSGAPKFPMPNNYECLLDYSILTNNDEALTQVENTLKKMAFGGVYDQIGGGFARYSVDGEWRVPHFEKMLYDNAQLISLYSKAFQKTKNPLYEKVVRQTIEWTEREMTGPDGEFYSALDADSEGEEGKFYTWPEVELKEIIGEDWESFTKYYDLKKGKWEGRIILMRADHSEVDEELVTKWEEKLTKVRDERVRPGLDDKSLTSWNAMMITGLVDAYKAFGEKSYLKIASQNAKWLLKNQVREDGSLFHSYKKGRSTIDGLIEDYAFSIQGFLKLYEATFDEQYLRQAEQWMNFAIANFGEESTGFFYTRSKSAKQLIAKSTEVHDNVIPAANSVMAHNLFRLHHLLGKGSYLQRCEKMLGQMDKERMLAYGSNYSNWAQLLLHFNNPFYEVAICGEASRDKYLEWNKSYLPNVLLQSSEKESDLPLLENRLVKGETYIYVCENRVCQLPVKEVGEAISLINQ